MQSNRKWMILLTMKVKQFCVRWLACPNVWRSRRSITGHDRRETIRNVSEELPGYGF
jgi:hypothetical protein